MQGRDRGEGWGLPLNGGPAQITQRMGQGGGDKQTAMEATSPQRPRVAAAARPAVAEGRTPTQTGQCVVNDDTRSAGGRGGGRGSLGLGQPGGGRPASHH